MRARLAVALLILAGLAFHLPAWVEHWRPTWDSAVYLTLARNLADGEGYTWEGVPHLKYPPGLSLLLAPLAGDPDSGVRAERALMILCALAWMLLLYRGLRGRWGEGVAFWTALVAGLNYGVLWHTIQVLSDVPFLVPWTLALLAGERLRREPDARNAWLWLLAFLLACAVRIVAVVQLPVFALLLWKRFSDEHSPRCALGVAFALAALLPGLWFLRTEILRSELPEDLRDLRSYEHEMATGESYEAGAEGIGPREHLEIVWGNLDYYRGLLGEALSAHLAPARTRFDLHGPGEQIGWWFGLAVALALIAAALWLYRAGHAWLVLSSLFYFLLIVAWPSRQGVRFLLPLYPLLFLALVAGGRAALRRLPARLATAAVPVALLAVHLAALIAGNGGWGMLYSREHAEPYHSAGEQSFFAAGEYVARELPEARLACDEAAWLVYCCGAHARSFPILTRGEPDEVRGARLLAELRSMGITHVLVLPGHGRFADADLIAPLVSHVGLARLLERWPALAGPFDPAAFVVPLERFDP